MLMPSADDDGNRRHESVARDNQRFMCGAQPFGQVVAYLNLIPHVVLAEPVYDSDKRRDESQKRIREAHCITSKDMTADNIVPQQNIFSTGNS